MKKNKYEKFIFSKLYSKYKIDNTIYALNIIDNIIFNERSHLVSTFKDYLILDDEFEFLKKFYNFGESKKRLNAILNYYSVDKQFPNYSNLKEANFILKNINSKKEMEENIQNSLRQKRKNENIALNSKENLSNTIFNSKVYESIINDSENCLSVFYDKESLCNKNIFDSTNKKDDEINKLIENFEDIGNNITFSFANKNENEKIPKLDNSLIKDFNLETFNENNKLTKIQNYQKIYKKKKTPCNSINRRKNIISNTTKIQKKFDINNNENLDYMNYKNLILYSQNNHNIIGIKSKKNNQNTSPNPIKKNENSSIPYLDTYTDNSEKNGTIKTPNSNNNKKKRIIRALRPNHYKLNSESNINENLLRNNLLTERIHPIIKVKINMKKNERKINGKQTKINAVNKNILKNSEKEKMNITKSDNTKNLYLKQKAKFDNIDMTYNYIKNNLINKNLININDNNRISLKQSVEKLNKHRSNSINAIKENKINLVKKNKDKENMHSNYAINKYKNKLSQYNNFTSIQFNNNNINIINSNSNNANHNTNNIYLNTYGNFFQKSDESNLINNLSNIGNKSQEFGKKRKKLNKKCPTYFISNNNEHLDKKLKLKNKLKFLENLNIMNNRINTNFNSIDSISHHRGINSDRTSTPFSSKNNKKIFLKIYKKANLSNNKDEKNHTIMNDTYKKYKIRFLENKIIRKMNNSNISDNFDNFNLTVMNQFNKTNTNMNTINFNNSNMNTINSSLYKKKKKRKASQIIYYMNKEHNDLLKKNFDINNKEDKKSLNNLGRIVKKKKIQKNNELLEIRKLDEKKKMIIDQFNQQMNQIKIKFIKEIENKFEISKRNIIKRRSKIN